MTTSHQSYIGSGDVYLREVGAAAGLVKVANISKLDIGAEEETKSLKAGKGNVVVNEIRRVSAVTCSMTVHSFDSTALAIALRATGTDIIAGTVVNEARVAYKGTLVRLAFLDPTAVVVTGPSGTPTYNASTDYTVTAAGILIPETSTIANGAAIEVDYSYGKHAVIEALLNSGKEYEMVFDGINEADSGKPVLVDAWRFKPGVLKQLALFGEDFAGFDLEGALLADTSKAVGKSQYYRVVQKTA